MANLHDLARRMEILADGVEQNTNDVVRKCALVVDQSLVMGTPVDTGRARSNWIASIGTATEGIRDPYYAGKRLGVGETANASAAMAQAQQVFAKRQIGQEIHIVNNLPYIESLDGGHSTQASPGMIGRAIDNGIEAVRRLKVVK